jgi:hypothetical protein
MRPPNSPNRLIVDDVRVDIVNDTLELSATVAWDQPPAGVPTGVSGSRLVQRIHDITSLHIGTGKLRDQTIDSGATSLLPVVTMLAAVTGAELSITAPVCPVAVAGAKRAAAKCNEWFGWANVSITVPDPAGTTSRAHGGKLSSGTGLFFSRGLDSMAVLIAMTNAGIAPTHLVGMDWVDPPYESPGQRDIWAATAAAAAEGGHTLVRMSTNARAFCDPVVHWSLSHAVVLSASALLLSPMVGSVGISSTYSADRHQAYGSHRDLDPLWSSQAVSIEHRTDVPGDRLAKAAVVARDEWACRWLKVCWERPGEGNCGTCRKCLMTMAYLWLVGRGDVVGARFDGPLVPEAIVATASDQPMRSPENFVNVAVALHDVANGHRRDNVTVGADPSERRFAAILAEAWDTVLNAAGAPRPNSTPPSDLLPNKEDPA